ncbi:unnamed protein product [Symbiodinium pilosum]|uniref:Uncharacterized protein n=1 Tax=Symbiodinium pilosum TaxID=2952 RepID=A0A812VR88_SYMPI|nr:unnamed protein product [Symbiodinium pilosum]
MAPPPQLTAEALAELAGWGTGEASEASPPSSPRSFVLKKDVPKLEDLEDADDSTAPGSPQSLHLVEPMSPEEGASFQGAAASHNIAGQDSQQKSPTPTPEDALREAIRKALLRAWQYSYPYDDKMLGPSVDQVDREWHLYRTRPRPRGPPGSWIVVPQRKPRKDETQRSLDKQFKEKSKLLHERTQYRSTRLASLPEVLPKTGVRTVPRLPNRPPWR